MARNINKRPYGSGNVIELKNGVAIRWRESVIGADGVVRRELRYESLGDVSKKEAEGRLQEKLSDRRRQGPRQEHIIPTFQELVDRYKRDSLSMKRFSTRVVRETILQTHLLPRFGPMPISDITTAEIQRFITELREAGYWRKQERRDYAPHTLHDLRSVFRSVMNRANKWYRLPVDPLSGQPFNPVVGIELPALTLKHAPWALTPEQAGKLIGRLRGKAKAMVALAITCGMRRGELLAFRLGHLSVCVDPDGRRFGVINVKEASYLGHIGPPKTEAGCRSIDVHPWVLDLIEDWTQSANKKKPEDLVFGTRTNRLENSNNILRRHVFPACAAIGVNHATWLTFRRTYSTWAHIEGIPARTIADVMGHAKVDTQFIYTRPVAEMKRVAADKVGEKLCKIVQIFEREPALIQ